LNAARFAKRDFFFAETARLMARALRTDNAAESADDMKALRNLFGAAAAQLEEFESDGEVPKERIEEVVTLLDRKIGELNYLVRGSYE
jgi:hypothetical protein